MKGESDIVLLPPETDPHLVLAEHYITIRQPDRALTTLGHADRGVIQEINYWVLSTKASYLLEKYEDAVASAHN